MRRQQEVTVWVCEHEGCGHWWLAKTEKAPHLCASCRRTGWHKTKSIGELVREKVVNLDDRLREIVRDEFAKLADRPRQARPMATPEILSPARPDMNDLRDMAAGILPPPASPSLTAYPGTPCPYTEYDDQTGETYACGLSVHPPKVRHTRGAAIG